MYEQLTHPPKGFEYVIKEHMRLKKNEIKNQVCYIVDCSVCYKLAYSFSNIIGL